MEYIALYGPAQGFPCGSAGKVSTCNVGDLGLIPELGRSPGEGEGYPLQYSGLENSMDYIQSRGCKELDTTERLSLPFYRLALVQRDYFSCHSVFSIDILFGVFTHSDICLYFFFSILKLNLAMLGLPCCEHFSLVAEGYCLVAVCSLLWQWLLLFQGTGSRVLRLQ